MKEAKQIYKLAAVLLLLAIVMLGFCFQNITICTNGAPKSVRYLVIKKATQSSSTQSSSNNDLEEEEEDEDNKVDEVEPIILTNEPIILLEQYIILSLGYKNLLREVASPPPWAC